MSARPSLRILALCGALLAAATSGVACKKNAAAPAGAQAVPTRKPYTPVRPPPTRTLKPGEPTPLPRLPE
ncbi:MAG TPA: hypothetical protein VIA45_01820 [Thermoanaerobaculia bacterium]